MPGEREWLQAEKAGQAALGEAMFARLIADLPPLSPVPLSSTGRREPPGEPADAGGS